MLHLIIGLIIFSSIVLVTWLISFGFERMRAMPSEPKQFDWLQSANIQYTNIDGIKIRYLKIGTGPDLVLFHTLRTQLDIFQKMMPMLSSNFTVYVMDYPGHGWSDITEVDYHPNNFYKWAEQFLDKIDVKDATVAGISIGGTIVLELAARNNSRIKKAISINPYDYLPSYSAGLKGSSTIAKIIFSTTGLPMIGETVMRMRNDYVERMIFEGGVVNPVSLSDNLFEELVRTGNRKGYQKGFLNLLRRQHYWQNARKNYPNIKLPVLLVYGDQDWAPDFERDRTKNLISNAQLVVIKNGGHFLSLDKPDELSQLITDF